MPQTGRHYTSIIGNNKVVFPLTGDILSRGFSLGGLFIYSGDHVQVSKEIMLVLVKPPQGQNVSRWHVSFFRPITCQQ